MSPAREIAFRVLQRVHGGGYATDLLRRESGDPRDLALAESIVLGCLRYQAQLDYLIEHFSGRKQPKLDDEVRIALRMGIFQLRYLDRIPPHAAVAESVELVKQAHKRSAAGFVNAVLRKVNRSPIAWPDQATELSLPAWMLERWQQQYGQEAAAAIARAALEQPEAAINPDTGRQQDPGAQSIVPLLEIQPPGMTVLDLCAAPGNKTAQILALGAHVIAVRPISQTPGRRSRRGPARGPGRRHGAALHMPSSTESWSTRPAREPEPWRAIPRSSGGCDPTTSRGSPICNAKSSNKRSHT